MYSLSYMLIGTFAIHNICKEYTLIMDKETPGRILIANIDRILGSHTMTISASTRSWETRRSASGTGF